MTRTRRVAGAWRRCRLLTRLAVALPLGAAGLAAQAVAVAPAAQAAPTTTFLSTGKEQSYMVPPGTTAVQVMAVGAGVIGVRMFERSAFVDLFSSAGLVDIEQHTQRALQFVTASNPG